MEKKKKKDEPNRMNNQAIQAELQSSRSEMKKRGEKLTQQHEDKKEKKNGKRKS
ncbi:hypothetical protein HYC85_029795 [Camellia sinensis]|uniref:Uncharacterized protein n=1 Tax=Camellia sinensis TaxID=4442 RepID=A0A7J7G2U3_CAMSI|nr:hypothetical protein HYC85_029795 [Camellia sinensis]